MAKRKIPGSAIYEMIDDAGNVHQVRCDWVLEQTQTPDGWDDINPHRETYTLAATGRVLIKSSDGTLLDRATGKELYRRVDRGQSPVARR